MAGPLHFEEVDLHRYPCFSLALGCARKGQTYPCFLNAAGEVAVEAFLKGQIKYTQISELISGTLAALEPGPAESYAALAAADGQYFDDSSHAAFFHCKRLCNLQWLFSVRVPICILFGIILPFLWRRRKFPLQNFRKRYSVEKKIVVHPTL